MTDRGQNNVSSYSKMDGVDQLVISRPVTPGAENLKMSARSQASIGADSSTLTSGMYGGLLGEKNKKTKIGSPTRVPTADTAMSALSESTSRPGRSANAVMHAQLVSAAGSLAHVGEYIKPEYLLGRRKRWTGCWSCCGDEQIYSISCKTVVHREKYMRNKIETQEREKQEAERRSLAKERRKQWEKDKMAHEEMLKRERDHVIDVDADKFYRRTPKEGLPPGSIMKNPPLWEKALMNSNVYDSLLESLDGGNVCMVVSTMRKNMPVEFYQEQGLKALRHLALHHESRRASLHHNALKAVLAAQKAHPYNMEIQGLCVQVLGTYSKHHDSMKVVTGDPECAENTVKNLIHFENKPEIVGQLLAILRAVSANADRIPFLIKSRAFHSVLRIMRMHSEEPELMADGLACWQNASSTLEGRELVMERDLIPFCVDIIKKYRTKQNPKVLGNAIGIITYACGDVEGCIKLLEVKGLETVLSGMKNLIASHKLQLRGLVMVHNVAKLDSGWEELERIQGAWQWLTQGVDKGNILIHYNKGHFHNRGWSIGDAPHQTVFDPVPVPLPRHVLEKWTVQKLREFMGVKYPEQMYKIGFNKKSFEQYHKYIGELGLFPFRLEPPEAWSRRIRAYEEFNGVNIRTLVEDNMDNRSHSDMSSTISHHRNGTPTYVEISDALAALDWPDSRPNSTNSARGSSRANSRGKISSRHGSRQGSRGLPGEALMTFSRSSSRNEARASTNSLDVYDRTMITSAGTDNSGQDFLDHRPNTGTSGRGSALGIASRDRALQRQSSLVKDRADRQMSLQLGVEQVGGLIGLQDPLGIGMMGTRPFSNESQQRPVAFSYVPPLSRELNRPGSVSNDERPVSSSIVTFADLPSVEERGSNLMLADVAFGSKFGKVDGAGGRTSGSGFEPEDQQRGLSLPALTSNRPGSVEGRY